MITKYHAKYYANMLTGQAIGGNLDCLSQSLLNASVDINPHQIEAALFAFKSPLAKGIILADEVGLGKTIEAGLVLCQYWAIGKRKIIVVCPASLRKQWGFELTEKFGIDNIVLDSKNYNDYATQQARLEYWTAFNEYAFKNAAFSNEFKRRKPGTDHWLSFSMGSSGCGINILRLQNSGHVAVEVYINDDKDLFHTLFENKTIIESEIGFKLDWRELPEKKASRILVKKEVALSDKTKWSEQFDWIMVSMIKIKQSFKKYL